MKPGQWSSWLSRARLSPERRRLLAGPTAVVGLSVVAFSVLLWASGAPAQTQAASAPPAVDIAVGEALYNAHCESCHGAGGVGGVAPQLVQVGAAAADFYLSTGRMPLDSVHDQPTPHTPYFSKAQIADIVAYINALGVEHGTPGPGIPSVTPACAEATAGCPTLSQGQQLYLMNCAQCHDASGSGGELSHGYVVPSLRSATPTQVAEAARVGPRPMPSFGPGQLSNEQLSAIADYVHYLSTTPDPGGLGIAHFGPVPEGFVGVIFGLGVLLVAARLIGNRG